jgi:hypothetical protein
MKLSLQLLLAQRYPTTCGVDENGVATTFVQCNQGWFDLLDNSLKLMEDRNDLLNSKIIITKVLNENGRMKIITSQPDEYIQAVVDMAYLVSGQIDENTGESK